MKAVSPSKGMTLRARRSVVSGGCVGSKCERDESSPLEYHRSAGAHRPDSLQAPFSARKPFIGCRDSFQSCSASALFLVINCPSLFPSSSLACPIWMEAQSRHVCKKKKKKKIQCLCVEIMSQLLNYLKIKRRTNCYQWKGCFLFQC